MISSAPKLWRAVLLGAVAAAAAGGLEAAQVLATGRLQLGSPAPVLLAGVLGGALLGAPGGALAAWARRLRPALAGLLVLAWLELALAVATDAPPHQEAPWWVGSPLALIGGGLGALGLALALSRLGRVGAALGLLALVGARWSGPPPAPPARGAAGPNLLLVTLDTTRADRSSVYGGPAPTPHLARLAAEGLVFERAFSPIAVTGPAHLSLMSGAGTWRHGVLLNGVPAPDDRPLLAERARAAGYRTAAFVSAYVLDRRVGLDRGFEVYDDDFSTLRGVGGLLPARLLAAASRRLDPDHVLERRGDDTAALALDWLEGTEGPWMLWVHLFDAHGPYLPPAPYDVRVPPAEGHTPMPPPEQLPAYLRQSVADAARAEEVVARYDGEIAFADAQLGRLLDAVDARGEAGRTIVVVVGDHGESLGERGTWFDHGGDVLDPALRVPLVLRWPEGLPAGQRRDDVVELMDLAPSLTGWMGLEPLPEPDGEPLGEGGAQGPARSLIFDREANLAARARGEIERPTWRMVGLRSRDALYVHREAPSEFDMMFISSGPTIKQLDVEIDDMSNFMSEPGAEAALGALREQAGRLLRAGEAGAARSAMELGEEERARLEALGYID